LLHPFSFRKTKSLATTVRVNELATSLSKMGVEVYVFTPYERSYETPDGVKVVGLDNTWLELGLSEKVYNLSRKVYHTRALYKLFTRFFLKRTLKNPSRPFFKLVDAIHKYEIDVLQVVQDVAALSLLGVKNELDLPLAVDLHTVFPEEVVATGVVKKASNDFNISKKIEEQILQTVDLIIVLGETMYNHVISNYQVDKKKVIIVEPGARSRVNAVPERDPPAKVLYSGIVSYRKNFKLFLDAIPFVYHKKTDTQFFATKKGDLVDWASSYIRRYGIRNFMWYWFPDMNKFYDFMYQCHVGVITNEDSEANRMDMPSKLFDYMSLGVPVVTNYIGGWTNIVKQSQVGITTKNTPESFAEGITTLLENPELIHDCGENGIELIKERFNWDTSAKKLYQGYLSLKK